MDHIVKGLNLELFNFTAELKKTLKKLNILKQRYDYLKRKITY